MVAVSPVNYSYPQQSPVVYNTIPQPKVDTSTQTMGGQKAYVDLTDSYSQKEIRNILKRIGTDTKLPAPMNYVPRYAVMYYSGSETLVIHNTSMTNDTTEILKDGSVRHVGSWHNKEVAPAGSFNDVIEDAKLRVEEDNNPA